MMVKVGNRVYSGSQEPVMVILRDQDRANIQNMVPGATSYCVFPDHWSVDDIRAWMAEGLVWDRMDKANELIKTIASCGRKYFSHTHRGTGAVRIARFELAKKSLRARVRFRDEYTDKLINVHNHGKWNGFHHGRTMKNLVEALRDYIVTGEPIDPYHFGPWPESLRFDLWGYGTDIEIVRARARELGIVVGE